MAGARSAATLARALARGELAAEKFVEELASTHPEGEQAEVLLTTLDACVAPRTLGRGHVEAARLAGAYEAVADPDLRPELRALRDAALCAGSSRATRTWAWRALSPGLDDAGQDVLATYLRDAEAADRRRTALSARAAANLLAMAVGGTAAVTGAAVLLAGGVLAGVGTLLGAFGPAQAYGIVALWVGWVVPTVLAVSGVALVPAALRAAWHLLAARGGSA